MLENLVEIGKKLGLNGEQLLVVYQLALLDKQIQFEKAKAESLSLKHSFQHEDAPRSPNVSSRAKLPKLPGFNDQRNCIDAYLQKV